MATISVRTFRLVALAAVAVLLMGFMAINVARVQAATTVFLLPQQQGTASACGAGSAVTWHFVLNQLDPGTAPGSLTASFSSAGVLTDPAGDPVGTGKVQHFFVTTPSDDTLLNASAIVSTQSGTPMLLLSDVSCESPPEETPSETF